MLCSRSARSIGKSCGRCVRSFAAPHLDQAIADLEAQKFAASQSAYAQLLKKCGSARALSHGRRVHAHIVAVGKCLNTFLQNVLIEMYGKCGRMEDAMALFAAISRKNTYSFNIMISAAVRNGLHVDALELFEQMRQEGVSPDKFTYADVFNSCCSLGDLDRGRTVHARLVASDVQPDEFLRVAMLNMYAKLGELEEAIAIFESIQEKNTSVVAWNVMIAAFSQNRYPALALQLYRRLLLTGIPPDRCTLISVLSAVSSMRRLAEGKSIHELISKHGYRGDLVLDTALVDMYGKCGRVEEARMVFDGMQKRDIVTWNAMISAYAQQGYAAKASELYRAMESQGFKPELVTFVNLLVACSDSGDLSAGKAIHARLVDEKYELNLVAENTILSMYAKCGSLKTAKAVFDGLSSRDTVSWNSLIVATAENGENSAALQLCKEMALDGVEPDHTTFTCIFLCCSHGGMVEQGRNYFLSMISDHQVCPSAMHYQSMVDLLGRAGRLKEAQELMSVMPYQPGIVGWRAYLGACRTHLDKSRGSQAGGFASEVYPSDSSSYVLLSNIVST